MAFLGLPFRWVDTFGTFRTCKTIWAGRIKKEAFQGVRRVVRM